MTEKPTHSYSKRWNRQGLCVLKWSFVKPPGQSTVGALRTQIAATKSSKNASLLWRMGRKDWDTDCTTPRLICMKLQGPCTRGMHSQAVGGKGERSPCINRWSIRPTEEDLEGEK
eukprot:scaffold1771_cov343-Pavlova_lutheri.AAC.22